MKRHVNLISSAKHHYSEDLSHCSTCLPEFLAKTSNSANIFAGLTGGEGEVLKAHYTQESSLIEKRNNPTFPETQKTPRIKRIKGPSYRETGGDLASAGITIR